MSQNIYPPIAEQAQATQTETPLYAEDGKTYSQTLTPNVELRVSDKDVIRALHTINEQLEDVRQLLTMFLEKL